jgi:hypothetical protein
MKVKELQQKLSEFDPDMEVVVLDMEFDRINPATKIHKVFTYTEDLQELYPYSKNYWEEKAHLSFPFPKVPILLIE